jgi:hypothetical protein
LPKQAIAKHVVLDGDDGRVVTPTVPPPNLLEGQRGGPDEQLGARSERVSDEPLAEPHSFRGISNLDGHRGATVRMQPLKLPKCRKPM